MHVCVIGAGVVGLTTAYFLRSEGHSVTVLDRAGAPAATSGANDAQLRYSVCALPGVGFPIVPLALLRPTWSPAHWQWFARAWRESGRQASLASLESLLKLAELSREFIEPLIEGEGLACQFHRTGRLIVYADAQRLPAARAQMQAQIALGSRLKLLTRDECIAREPALAGRADRVAGGIWVAGDAAADSAALAAQLAALLERRGVELAWGRTALRFDLDGDRVRAVIARNAVGEAPVRADAFVIAAGAGAPEIAASAGLRLPLRSLAGHSITIRPEAAALPTTALTDAGTGLSYSPLGDRVRVSALARLDRLEHAPRQTARLLDAARELLGYRVVDGDVRPWSGALPTTPGGRPLLGATPVRGLYLNVAHGPLGTTLAAGSARLLCDAIGRRPATIAAAAFSYPAT